MFQKFRPRLVTGDDTNEPVAMTQLSDQQLGEISAGGAAVASDDDAPKESMTLDYGRVIFTYQQQH